MMQTHPELDRLIATPKLELDELFAVFDRLAPVTIAFMLGEWTGGVFATGHPGERQLDELRWDGKQFIGADVVEPIVVRDAAGVRKPSPVMGQATLRMIEHRGVSTATMVYDRHPIFDYFRKLDDATVLGVMDRKGDEFPLFFYLRRL